MDALDLVDKLITLPDVTTKLRFLDESSSFLSDEVANLLKQKADQKQQQLLCLLN